MTVNLPAATVLSVVSFICLPLSPLVPVLTETPVIFLNAAAIFIAVCLVSFDHRNQKRRNKADHSQPGKQNIKKSKHKIDRRKNPKIIVPLFLMHPLPPPV